MRHPGLVTFHCLLSKLANRRSVHGQYSCIEAELAFRKLKYEKRIGSDALKSPSCTSSWECLKSLASADSSTKLMICSAPSCGCQCLPRMRSLFSTSKTLGSQVLVQCDACPPLPCRVCLEQMKRTYACTLATTWSSHCCMIVCDMLKHSRHVAPRL
jgi:hypothetical protein